MRISGQSVAAVSVVRYRRREDSITLVGCPLRSSHQIALFDAEVKRDGSGLNVFLGGFR